MCSSQSCCSHSIKHVNVESLFNHFTFIILPPACCARKNVFLKIMHIDRKKCISYVCTPISCLLIFSINSGHPIWLSLVTYILVFMFQNHQVGNSTYHGTTSLSAFNLFAQPTKYFCALIQGSMNIFNDLCHMIG